ncbi:MAG: hypothetical protein IH599_06055, partial [Bacteroidales bacterium]|nr:hypothetical protein [Bacteroidales bacterium]
MAEPSICVSQNTTYWVRATEPFSGCLVRDTISILVNPAQVPVAYAGEDTTLCLGQSLMLGMDGPDSLIYVWNGPATFNPSPVTERPQITPNVDGTYHLMVIDPVSGCTAEDEVDVEVVDLQVDAGDDQSICLGTSVTLEAEVTGGSVLDILWTPATGLDNPSTLRPVASPQNSTAYEVMVTDLVSGCKASDQVVVNVIPISPPQLNLQEGLIACQDPGKWIQIGVSPQPNVIYQWSLWSNSVFQPGGVLSNWSIANPELNISNWAGHTQNYPNYLYLTATDTSLPSQCATTKDSMSYRVILLPNPTMPDDQQICLGDSVQLTASTAWPYPSNLVLPLSYSWTPATGLSDPGNLVTYASPSQTTIYELNVGLAPMSGITVVGCGTTEAEVLVEVTLIPQLQVPDLVLDCHQGSEDRHLVFPYSTQYSYHWE